MVKELNKPNKDVTNIIEHLTQMIQLKRIIVHRVGEGIIISVISVLCVFRTPKEKRAEGLNRHFKE